MSCNAEFIFTWVVEKIKLFPQNGECIISPTFLVKQFFNTRWCLVLYPRGIDLNSVDYVSCYLVRLKDNVSHEIEIDFQLSIDSVSKSSKYCFKNESLSYGWTRFLPRKSLEQVHNCVVECHMRMFSSVDLEVDITEKPSQFLMPFTLNSQTLIPVEESSLLEEEVGEKDVAASSHCSQSFARTCVANEKEIFTCTIKDDAGGINRLHISVRTSSAILSLMLFLRNEDNIDLLETEISLKSKRNSDCMLTYKIELIDSKKRIYSSAEENYLFESNKADEKWNFGHRFRYPLFEEIKKPYFRMTLLISDGYYFSAIERSSEMNNCVDTLNFSSGTAKGFHQMLTGKKYCDMTIRVENESFDCHKIVLCSVSPVFAAMFKSDMKERNTNIVHVDDLDKDTVHQMLRYLYTGSTGALNAESAMKLFSAADKYHIIYLMDICRNVLKYNLTQTNIFAILMIADAHQDNELLESSITFFSCHRRDLLESKKWKKLKIDNMNLALDILTKVYMKFFPLASEFSLL